MTCRGFVFIIYYYEHVNISTGIQLSTNMRCSMQCHACTLTLHGELYAWQIIIDGYWIHLAHDMTDSKRGWDVSLSARAWVTVKVTHGLGKVLLLSQNLDCILWTGVWGHDSWNSVQQIWLSVDVGLVGTAGPAARCLDKDCMHGMRELTVSKLWMLFHQHQHFHSLSLNICYHHFNVPNPLYVPILLHLCGELYHCIISLILFRFSSSTSREPFLAMQHVHTVSIIWVSLRATLWQCWQSLHGEPVCSRQLPCTLAIVVVV